MPQMVDEAGNIWEVDAQGNPVSFVGKQGAQQGAMTIGTPNNAKIRGDELKNQLTQAQINKMISDMNKPDAESKPKLPVGMRMKADGTGAEMIPGVPAPGTNAAGKTDKAGAYQAVIDQINRTYELYNQSIGQTSGIAGLMDYLPTEANAMFDTAGAALGDQGNAAFKVPGMGAQSDADAARFVAANQPQASDRDGAALEKLRALRQRLEANMGAVGLPAPQFNFGLDGQPIGSQPGQRDQTSPAGNVPQGADRSNRDEVLFGTPSSDSQNGGFVPYGAQSRIEPNPQFKGMNAAVKGMIVAGRPSQEIKAFMNSKGIAGDTARGIDDAINYYRKTGKSNFRVDVENMSVPMSGFEQFRNNVPQTSAGTALATAGNAGGFGIPQMLAGGEGLDYLRSQNPVSAFAGDVGGVIGGTAMLGRAGANVTGKIAPSLLGGGAKAAAGRQLATDAGYGAIYGGTTEGTPQGVLTGALTAGVGSLGGQTIGKGIQTLGRGINAPGAAQLYDQGITPTLGQIGRSRGGIIGNAIGGLEDRIGGLPFIGEAVGNARNRGLQQSNIGDLNNALKPIGGRVDDYGANGFAAADDATGEAYSDALNPMRMQVDDGLREAMDRVPQYRDIIEQNLDNGMMTGRGFQAAKRTIDGEIASATGQPMGYKTLPPLQTLRDSMFASAERQAPESLAQYRLADEAYNNLVPIRAATAAAENTGGLYTPAQLGRSLRSTDRSAGKRATARGERPGQDMQTLKQEILPSKVPDSGTIGRGLVAAGVGLPAVGGATINPLFGLAALPAAAYTKLGQDLVAKALLAERPKLIRQGAGMFGGRKARKALSGAITAPLLTDY